MGEPTQVGLRISDAFVRAARAAPLVPALHGADGSLSYGELEQASRALAWRLSEALGAHSVVAIHGRRSARMVVAMLACARADMTFAVLDSAYPPSRIGQMVSLVRPALTLVIDSEAAEFEPERRDALGAAPLWPVTRASVRQSLGSAREGEPGLADARDGTAYLLFTSGTTGVPKCIQTGHQPLAHFVRWYVRRFEVGTNDRFSLLSGLGHDPILRDVFVPLSTGATLCIPDNDIVLEPRALFEWFRAQRVSFAHATPQLLKILSAGAKGDQTLPALRYVFSGGDALRSTHVEPLFRLSPGCQVVNFYGTTETPQAVAFHLVQPSDLPGPIPVGRAIDDVTLHVLRDDLQPVSPGEQGQVGIQTEYLSKGYLNDDGMTRGRFIQLPNQPAAPPVYLTGDYGALRDDGALLLKGRIDDQVKVRGFRVELGEVVAALELEPGIRSAVVLPSANADGETVLVACLAAPTLAASGPALGHDAAIALKAAVGRRVPSYMVPARFVVVEALPLLPNGKVDRQALTALAQAADASTDALDTSGLNEDGRRLVQGFEKALGYRFKNTDASFLEHGGDSLSYVQASVTVETVLGWLPDNWDALSVHALVKLKKARRDDSLSINSSIVARAISIAVIVLDHYGFLGRQVGMTSALFVVAGWSFGRYQINSIYRSDSTQSVWEMMGKIALPTALFVLAQQVFTNALHPSSLLFLDNLVDPDFELQHRFSYYWFIDVLLQMMVVTSLLFTIRPLRSYAFHNQFKFGLLGVVGALAAGALGIYLWDTWLTAYVPPTSSYVIGQLPHLRLWLFFLGIAIAAAVTARQKALLVALVAVVFVLTRLLFRVPINISIASVPVVLLLIVKDKVKVPTRLVPVINNLAGASLFIYLGHMVVYEHLKGWINATHPLLLAAATFAACIALWRAWEPVQAWVIGAFSWLLRSLGFTLRRDFARPSPETL